MAALSMVSSAAAAVLAAPVVGSVEKVSFSAVGTVRMTPVKRRMSAVVMAVPQEKKEGLKDQIASAIAEAQKTCEDDPASAPCAVAWDDVEELSAEDAHRRSREKASSDPLETYCADNPETDECRTYED